MGDSPRLEALRRRVLADPASVAFAALAEEYRRAGRLAECHRDGAGRAGAAPRLRVGARDARPRPVRIRRSRSGPAANSSRPWPRPRRTSPPSGPSPTSIAAPASARAGARPRATGRGAGAPGPGVASLPRGRRRPEARRADSARGHSFQREGRPPRADRRSARRCRRRPNPAAAAARQGHRRARRRRLGGRDRPVSRRTAVIWRPTGGRAASSRGRRTLRSWSDGSTPSCASACTVPDTSRESDDCHRQERRGAKPKQPDPTPPGGMAPKWLRRSGNPPRRRPDPSRIVASMLTAPTAALAARLSRVRHEHRRARPRRAGGHAPPQRRVPDQFRREHGDRPRSPPRRLYLLTDFRYAAAVQGPARFVVVRPPTRVRPRGGLLRGGLAATLERTGARVAGLETASLPWKRVEWWRVRLGAHCRGLGSGAGRPGGRWSPPTGWSRLCGCARTSHEVAVFREAAGRLSDVARGVLADVVRAGADARRTSRRRSTGA